jgi:hypothetical protein
MKNFNVENIFRYHAPRPDQLPRYEAIRAKAREFALLLDANCPDSREKSTAFTHLQNAVMWVNASIAITESAAETSAVPTSAPASPFPHPVASDNDAAPVAGPVEG